MPAKVITEILDKYATAPKSNMQALEDHELSIVFEHLTQNNQISNIAAIYADEPKKPEAPKVEAPKAEAPKAQSAAAQQTAKPAQQPQQRPAQQGQQKPAQAQPQQKPVQQVQRPAQQQAVLQQKSNKSTATAQPTTRVPEKKLVDTRKGGDVNLAKYDQRLEELGGQRGERMAQKGGKEKFRNNKGRQGGQVFSNKRRQDEAEKMRKLQLEIAKKAPVKVQIPDEISVGELASRMKKTGAEVVKCLMKNGVMASLSQMIDFDTASFVAEELGCKVEKEVVVTIEEKLIDTTEDRPEDLVPRAPVVVVMGHVDHGKTSLLDTIRNTSVASGEAGGITQHIGASEVMINGRKITFVDTPGHEAFTAMRARGAKITDVVVLVVAADDGVMPQTIEAINHSKAAGVPIIVAVNKCDKEEANPDKVRQMLTEYGIIPEEWGGQNMFVNVSAKKNIGIDELLETILLQADVLELKANPDTFASGNIIEAKLDRGRGPVATLLVTRGTLHVGDTIVAGQSYGSVRAMLDQHGEHKDEARPSDAVEILGLNSVPAAGDEFRVFEDARDARDLAEQRALKARIEEQNKVKHVTLETLFEEMSQNELKELNLVVKADTQGTIEALADSIGKMDQSEVRINIIHSAVGAISETDVSLAAASNAIIIGFGVRPQGKARDAAEKESVQIKTYSIIYKAIEDIDAARIGMLAPTEEEVQTGCAEVRDTFRVPKAGLIAGCMVTEGEINRDDKVRVVRDGVVIFDGEFGSMRRFKDDVKTVKNGYECGLGIEKFQDIKVGDIFEAYKIVEVARTE